MRSELRPLLDEPDRLFRGSLNGPKVFDLLYEERGLPQAILDEDLSVVYGQLVPRVAAILCAVPPLVKEWEREAWSENYRHLDEMAEQLRSVSDKVDALSDRPGDRADQVLGTVRRAMALRVHMELDLTGLRADNPMAGAFGALFVHPDITTTEGKAERAKRVSKGTAEE